MTSPHWIGDNPSDFVTLSHLPDNGVPSEPARWGEFTGEAIVFSCLALTGVPGRPVVWGGLEGEVAREA